MVTKIKKVESGDDREQSMNWWTEFTHFKQQEKID